MPRAMLKTSIVDIFSGMPHRPITPAVTNNGIRLGINDISTILISRNAKTIRSEMTMNANSS